MILWEWKSSSGGKRIRNGFTAWNFEFDVKKHKEMEFMMVIEMANTAWLSCLELLMESEAKCMLK